MVYIFCEIYFTAMKYVHCKLIDDGIDDYHRGLELVTLISILVLLI